VEHSTKPKTQEPKKIFLIIIPKFKVMKKSSTSLLSRISNKELENLTIEVKETVAATVFTSNCRTFTVAELWNIQRIGRNRPQRRFL